MKNVAKFDLSIAILSIPKSFGPLSTPNAVWWLSAESSVIDKILIKWPVFCAFRKAIGGYN
jgi:hypothetical protein